MVFAGSGGQGIITAAIIMAEAAVLYENLIAVQTQDYGAAAEEERPDPMSLFLIKPFTTPKSFNQTC